MNNAALSSDLIHLWRVNLEDSAGNFEHLLSADERDRARRFVFDRDHRRFTISHAVLRVILGHYLNLDPHAVQFKQGTQGKPAISFQTPIRFNLSHSGERALVAVALEREVGVDIEFVRDVPDFESIARRFFSRGEVDALRSIPSPLQQEAFFTCWTRKEAYIKALGGGLSIPLDKFEVSVNPREPASLRILDNESDCASDWKLMSLDPADGYIAALAAHGTDWQYQCCDWPPPSKLRL